MINLTTFNMLLILLFTIGIIYVGLTLSKDIKSGIMYILFWLLYLATIITTVTAILNILFYLNIKDKTGPAGSRGEKGDKGEKGDTGICEEGCRNDICYKQLMRAINEEVNKLAGNPSKEIIVKNLYIKQRVKQICHSKEFKQLTPYRGPNDLISYLELIWRRWVKLIYQAGGRRYFETIGAENEFEWVNTNPFDEIKRYDIFYWGLDKDYRPNLIKKCDKKTDNKKTPAGTQKEWPLRSKFNKNQEHIHSAKGVIPSFKKETKYSVLNYLNMVPEGIVSNKASPKLKYKIITVNPDNPNLYSIKKIGTKECITIDKLGDQFSQLCNATRNKDQQFELEYTGRNIKELKLIHKESKQDFIPKEITDSYEKELEDKKTAFIKFGVKKTNLESKINKNDMNKFMLSK